MRHRTAGFAAMLVITMAMSVVAFFGLLVIASELQDELSISKLQIGLLAGVNTGIGGLCAPLGGRVCDELGGRRAMALVLLLSGISSLLIAAAPSYLWLLAAMSLAGMGQGLGNPATNKAIANGITSAQRGVVTGVKQSGVQLAVFIAGFTMPWVTSEYGWRTGLVFMAGLAFAAIPGVLLITELPADPVQTTPAKAHRAAQQLPDFVNQVALFGFLLGSIGGGVGGFLPLFAEEAAGFSAADAGRIFGLQGLIAVPTRIISGMLLDRGVSARKMLISMACVGSVALVLTLASSEGTPRLIWFGTILAGLSLGSWNTAANLAMIRENQNAGRASGRLILGFLLGTTLGGPMVGWSIDSFDSYRPAWLASAAIALAGAVVVSRYGEALVRRRRPVGTL